MLSIRVAGWWVAIGLLTGIGFWDADCRADLPSGFGEPNGILSAQEIRDGWIALFDGQTMFGWRPQDQANWRIDNATLTADSGQPCLVCTTTQFSDYVL